MDKSALVLLHRCEGRERESGAMGLRSRRTGSAFTARVQTRRYQAGRHDCRRWLPRKGRVEPDRCQARDTARWTYRLGRIRRRRRARNTGRPAMKAMCHLCLLLLTFTPALLAQELTAPDIKSNR